MKTLKIATLTFLIVLAASCSKNDTNDDIPVQEVPEVTTSDLLVSGKWYINGATGISLNSCMKEGYFHFVDSDTLLIETFDLSGGDCVSNGLESYTYLVNDSLINVFYSGNSTTLTIDFISESQLVLSTESGGSTFTYNLIH